jgi:hypothetical protein
VILASAAWVAVGTVAAHGPAATQSQIAVIPTPTDTIAPSDSPTLDPTATPTTPSIIPSFDTPAPTKPPFSMDIYKDGTFVSQMNKHACMAGALQNMLNIIGPKVDKTTARQVEISHLIVANTTKTDSKNGGYGPEGWAITLTQLGAGHYKLLVDNSLDQAMFDAATALRKTKRPVGLLSWWGAHSWVMTGFESDHDPRYYPGGVTVTGAYIVDPFYPRKSSIWGQTLGPDTLRDMTAMAHNYIGWKRPEGHYPGRDGKWLLVVPY